MPQSATDDFEAAAERERENNRELFDETRQKVWPQSTSRPGTDPYNASLQAAFRLIKYPDIPPSVAFRGVLPQDGGYNARVHEKRKRILEAEPTLYKKIHTSYDCQLEFPNKSIEGFKGSKLQAWKPIVKTESSDTSTTVAKEPVQALADMRAVDAAEQLALLAEGEAEVPQPDGLTPQVVESPSADTGADGASTTNTYEALDTGAQGPEEEIANTPVAKPQGDASGPAAEAEPESAVESPPICTICMDPMWDPADPPSELPRLISHYACECVQHVECKRMASRTQTAARNAPLRLGKPEPACQHVDKCHKCQPLSLDPRPLNKVRTPRPESKARSVTSANSPKAPSSVSRRSTSDERIAEIDSTAIIFGLPGEGGSAHVGVHVLAGETLGRYVGRPHPTKKPGTNEESRRRHKSAGGSARKRARLAREMDEAALRDDAAHG